MKMRFITNYHKSIVRVVTYIQLLKLLHFLLLEFQMETLDFQR